MKVLVCGGRDFQNRNQMWEVMAEIVLTRYLPYVKQGGKDNLVIIHGGARGAD